MLQNEDFEGVDADLYEHTFSFTFFIFGYKNAIMVCHLFAHQVDNVRLVDRYNSRKPIVGTLYLTATHLIFVDPAGKKETWVSLMKHQNSLTGFCVLYCLKDTVISPRD